MDKNKCAHPGCTCEVNQDDQYCSEQCQKMAASNPKCRCGHPGCQE